MFYETPDLVVLVLVAVYVTVVATLGFLLRKKEGLSTFKPYERTISCR